MKDEAEFTWGAEQQEAFEKIKKYLSSPPVLKAPKKSIPFRLYVAAEDKVIGVVLTQETEGKEYIITYVGRWLMMRKQGIHLLKNYTYHCIMLVTS